MRLVTFAAGEQARTGVLVDDGVVDLVAAEPALPRDMRALLATGPEGMARVRKAAARAAAVAPLADVQLLAPVPRLGKVLGIGMNYLRHVRELGRQPPQHQVWFNKQRTCITGPYDVVEIPVVSTSVDYEGELCMVIGRRCRHVPRERAHEVIAGFCVGNDVSVRDWQWRTPTMNMGKSFDTHGPLGPWLTTPDEIADPHGLRIRTWVNDELRQDATTGDMIFDCHAQIAHLSQAFTLEPGDVIFTGTPAGVGAASEPPRFLCAGDTVRVEVESLGALCNPVVDEVQRTVIE